MSVCVVNERMAVSRTSCLRPTRVTKPFPWLRLRGMAKPSSNLSGNVGSVQKLATVAPSSWMIIA